MLRRFFLLAALLFAPFPAIAAPDQVRVRFETSLGPIVMEVETRRAPITAANFLRYVDTKRYDNTSFYRAARSGASGRGLIQGGTNRNLQLAFDPIAHEPTSKTGLKHLDGTLSMARNAPGTAMADFFITVGPVPSLDAAPNYPGYAAFGRVISGMEIVRKILTLKTYPGGFSENTKGQTIVDKPRIITARRVG